MRICNLCGKPVESKRNRCGACTTKIRRIRCKIAAVKLMGGKCIDCGWIGNIAAFEFHHLDPNEKEFGIGNVSNKTWDVVKVELKKCVLLCSNCHAIRHTNRDAALMQAVEDYKGEELL